MSKVCQVCGKGVATGNNVSHANNRTKRRFLPNLQKKKVFDKTLGVSFEVKACTSCWKTISKKI